MDFIERIKIISEEHQVHNYNRFNIFQVMFKQHDEKYLHSRFISFLLDPSGSHNQGTQFLKLFYEVMGISNFSLEGVNVTPNQRERGEKNNIDILIINKQKQAVVIENKFFAKDQTKPEETDPFKKYQLLRYYKKIAEDEKFEVVKMIYLSIDGKDPEDFEKFPPEVKTLIATKQHLSDIAKWLDLCLEQLTADSDLKRSVLQYKQARFEFLNDVKLALKLKELTVTHFNEAKQFWFSNTTDPNLQVIQNQFIHVKWHTVHEFYAQLARAIKEEFKVNVTEASNKAITNLTHHNKKVATSVIFELNNNVAYYVCNDKNGFSIGLVNVDKKDKKEGENFEWILANKYACFDFSEEAFEIILPEKRDALVRQIVNALREFVNK